MPSSPEATKRGRTPFQLPELKQPLCAITNYADGLLHRLDAQSAGASDLHPAVQAIREQSERASHIIQNLREFARRREPQRTPLAIHDLVHEAMELTRTDVHKCGAEVDLQLNETLPTVLADRIEIEQILMNLLHNAAQAMAQAGCRPRRITVTADQDEADRIRLSVRDTGPGLSSQQLTQIFDPFFTTKADGMGIGLSICRTIAHHHEGQLWAENNPDAGLSLHLTLPTASDRTAS